LPPQTGPRAHFSQQANSRSRRTSPQYPPLKRRSWKPSTNPNCVHPQTGSRARPPQQPNTHCRLALQRSPHTRCAAYGQPLCSVHRQTRTLHHLGLPTSSPYRPPCWPPQRCVPSAPSCAGTHKTSRCQKKRSLLWQSRANIRRLRRSPPHLQLPLQPQHAGRRTSSPSQTPIPCRQRPRASTPSLHWPQPYQRCSASTPSRATHPPRHLRSLPPTLLTLRASTRRQTQNHYPWWRPPPWALLPHSWASNHPARLQTLPQQPRSFAIEDSMTRTQPERAAPQPPSVGYPAGTRAKPVSTQSSSSPNLPRLSRAALPFAKFVPSPCSPMTFVTCSSTYRPRHNRSLTASTPSTAPAPAPKHRPPTRRPCAQAATSNLAPTSGLAAPPIGCRMAHGPPSAR
jgi:hypothetical protein